ncbi:ROK family protein [Tsukamurella ocularis]|uniref:ROK family protein n=1 Tax=Tsukamurella ocularis TaxID=1970234 RepID=UPI0021687BF7|nr:ROK family protein [Tsukamurella ocularis]MCS3780016.1 putative NBD/HSP70 family sugar kinase [Tsukamurella ocularis]MCS3788584.1 putative NBD/HSP70 family sugar kinase [Tsukamurella ocularis]MCS3849794.1 putative NBD/HSP70 family sugar kinase [Tsukamurella ocularis]
MTAPVSVTAPRSPSPEVARFAADLGGTWLRVRKWKGSTVEHTAAPSLLNFPGTPVRELQDRLVEVLATAAPLGADAVISCGAALDHTSGILYGSGPLWGATDEPYDLVGALRGARPDVTWTLVNDLTAGLADFVSRRAGSGTRRAAYLTVSSGIALRTADLRDRTIPVDENGLQGEVGHLPTGVTFDGGDPLVCDCGVAGHVAAYSSGPGIERRARRAGVQPEVTHWLPAALEANDPLAQRILGTAIAPIAGLLRTAWCLDPHLDLVGVGGGVVAGIGAPYRTELLTQLGVATGYADRGFSREWLESRLVFCAAGDVDCLRGAELMRDGFLTAAM